MKTKAQKKKLEKKREDIIRLQHKYKEDKDFSIKMAKVSGAMYLAISVVDLCQQEIDRETYSLLIPAGLRKAIKDLSTACDRVIREEERNELMKVDNEIFQMLADDGRTIKGLLESLTGMTWSNYNKVSAYARNLANQEETERRKRV